MMIEMIVLASTVKQEPTEHQFVQQIHEGYSNQCLEFVFFSYSIFFVATEKAKKFVAQLNEQMKLYPEGYDGEKMNAEQRGQYVEQKEVENDERSFLQSFETNFFSYNRSIKR